MMTAYCFQIATGVRTQPDDSTFCSGPLSQRDNSPVEPCLGFEATSEALPNDLISPRHRRGVHPHGRLSVLGSWVGSLMRLLYVITAFAMFTYGIWGVWSLPALGLGWALMFTALLSALVAIGCVGG